MSFELSNYHCPKAWDFVTQEAKKARVSCSTRSRAPGIDSILISTKAISNFIPGSSTITNICPDKWCSSSDFPKANNDNVISDFEKLVVKARKQALESLNSRGQ